MIFKKKSEDETQGVTSEVPAPWEERINPKMTPKKAPMRIWVFNVTFMIVYVTLIAMNTKDKIDQILRSTFSVEDLMVTDDSHLHAGHNEAAKLGGTHFTVEIVSKDFHGKSRLQRHRMINHALSQNFNNGLHALVIRAKSPQ